jgi:hypothetical protein
MPTAKKAAAMKYYLVKYEDNYADEFDIQGFRIFTEVELKAFKTLVKTAKYPQEVYFGTNESISYDSFTDYMSRLDIEEVTEEEASLLTKLFGYDTTTEYGFFLNPEEQDEDDDSEEDEDD